MKRSPKRKVRIPDPEPLPSTPRARSPRPLFYTSAAPAPLDVRAYDAFFAKTYPATLRRLRDPAAAMRAVWAAWLER